MQELISVIVPIYNVEAYIDRCVESIVKQTYRNLEIILVDDGSTDKSPLICDKWRTRDERIQVIHKCNGGLSDARNAGIVSAKGEFYSFIDGDDEIDEKLIATLYNAMVSSGADISMCRMEKIENDRKYITRSFPFNTPEVVLSSEEAIKLLFRDIIDCSACLKLYNRAMFEKLQFPVGKTNEDFAIMYKVFERANRIAYIEDVLYFYHFRENSITSTRFNERQFDKYDNCLEMIEYVSKNLKNLLPEARFYLYRQTVYLLKTLCIMGIYDKYPKRYKELRNTLKCGTMRIILLKGLSLKEKGMYICISWFPRLYQRLQR